MTNKVDTLRSELATARAELRADVAATQTAWFSWLARFAECERAACAMWGEYERLIDAEAHEGRRAQALGIEAHSFALSEAARQCRDNEGSFLQWAPRDSNLRSRARRTAGLAV